MSRFMHHMDHLLAQKVKAFEKELLMDAIFRFGGHATLIAEHFKMGRNTLYNRLEFHRINLRTWRKQWRDKVRIEDEKVGKKSRDYKTKKL